MEKDSGGKLASLPPAKLNFSAKVTQIATGLQHTLLLTIHGEVYAFGSNNYGQLGLLDLNPRGIPTPVDLTPRGIFYLNRSSRRKRGMAFNQFFIIPDFFFAFSQ